MDRVSLLAGLTNIASFSFCISRNCFVDSFGLWRQCTRNSGANYSLKQEGPKVFSCAQIISLFNTEQKHLTRLPTTLPMCNVGRANVADLMR
jgi:hypothetical protein